MWRAFFLALGVYSCLLGAQCLVIDKAVLQPRSETSSRFTQRLSSSRREVVPPKWAPWSLLSAGSVVILYTFTLPQKMKV